MAAYVLETLESCDAMQLQNLTHYLHIQRMTTATHRCRSHTP